MLISLVLIWMLRATQPCFGFFGNFYRPDSKSIQFPVNDFLGYDVKNVAQLLCSSTHTSSGISNPPSTQINSISPLFLLIYNGSCRAYYIQETILIFLNIVGIGSLPFI